MALDAMADDVMTNGVMDAIEAVPGTATPEDTSAQDTIEQQAVAMAAAEA